MAHKMASPTLVLLGCFIIAISNTQAQGLSIEVQPGVSIPLLDSASEYSLGLSTTLGLD